MLRSFIVHCPVKFCVLAPKKNPQWRRNLFQFIWFSTKKSKKPKEMKPAWLNKNMTESQEFEPWHCRTCWNSSSCSLDKASEFQAWRHTVPGKGDAVGTWDSCWSASVSDRQTEQQGTCNRSALLIPKEKIISSSNTAFQGNYFNLPGDNINHIWLVIFLSS